MDAALPEGLENNPVNIGTINSDTLLSRIYDPKTYSVDPRFRNTDQGGVFRFFDSTQIKEPGGFFYPCVESEGKIVGLAELQRDPDNETNLWIDFVSVDPSYQGRGYGRKLLEEIFRFAQEHGYSLQGSSYSTEGEEKLKNIVKELRGKYSVKYSPPQTKDE